ncbi:MAG: glycosyltransferase family 39 protein [Bacteroidales bacterium]|nr:glycosyltransferase family 39 protein [Bacteroidales bacterium]
MKRTSKKNIQKPEISNKKQKQENKSKKTSFLQQNLKYLFLVLILFYIASNFYEQTTGNAIFENLKSILQIPTIIIGVISLYFDKTKLNNVINKLFAENKKQSFLQKFKNLFTKKELPATALLIIILGISAFSLFYKLDRFDIFSDEVQLTQGAAGYYHTDEYRQWDFIKKELVGKAYNRAKPHQWVTAQSYKLFGINTWSSRFPSAFFGVLFILLFYFIGKHFVKDKYTSLIAIFTFALYFEFLFLGRWARMYAMIYPVFLLAFYWVFKFLTENNSFQIFNSDKYPFLQRYFNFNYIYFPFLLILLYIGLYTHPNITAIFPVFLMFLLVSVFIFRIEKKYLTAFSIAVTLLILQILFPYKVNFSQFTFFEINNSEIYNKALFGYPFSETINLIFIFLSGAILFISKNNNFRKRYLILFSVLFIIWLLFSYIIDYAPSYRYISFLTPFTVLLIVGSFMLINKILYNKIIQTILSLMLIASVLLSFSNHYESLYVTNTYSPAKPSVAHKKVVKNIQKDDVIFNHWGPKMYLSGIPENTKFLSLGSYQGRSFSDLYKEIQENPHGWLIWHKYNEARLDPELVNFANLYFKKYAGYGIDNYGEEVYYYNKQMIQPLELFQYQQYMPAANLSLNNSYCFVFDLKITNNTSENIFYLNNNDTNILKSYIKDKKLIAVTSDKDSIKYKIKTDVLNRIYLQINPKKISLKVNNENEITTNINLVPDLVKFSINPQFNGYLNNIRIYDFNLNTEQINTIQNDTKISEELTANGDKFRTLFLWKKK